MEKNTIFYDKSITFCKAAVSKMGWYFMILYSFIEMKGEIYSKHGIAFLKSIGDVCLLKINSAYKYMVGDEHYCNLLSNCHGSVEKNNTDVGKINIEQLLNNVTRTNDDDEDTLDYESDNTEDYLDETVPDIDGVSDTSDEIYMSDTDEDFTNV
jgi:hypothetical protein